MAWQCNNNFPVEGVSGPFAPLSKVTVGEALMYDQVMPISRWEEGKGWHGAFIQMREQQMKYDPSQTDAIVASYLRNTGITLVTL